MAKVSLRKEIHQNLDLAMDRPLLRRSDSFQFKITDNANDVQQQLNKYLMNPHLSAKPSNGTYKF